MLGDFRSSISLNIRLQLHFEVLQNGTRIQKRPQNRMCRMKKCFCFSFESHLQNPTAKNPKELSIDGKR